VPLCPPQIPHDLTRAATMGSQRLTAWATGRPRVFLHLLSPFSYAFCVSSSWRVIFTDLKSRASLFYPWQLYFPFVSIFRNVYI
jgi:hypothetical protein